MYDEISSILTTNFRVPREQINGAASLAELGLDSLGFVELAEIIMERFGIYVDDRELEDLGQLNEIVTHLQKRVAANSFSGNVDQ